MSKNIYIFIVVSKQQKNKLMNRMENTKTKFDDLKSVDLKEKII